MLSLLHSPGGAASVCRLAVCATPQLQRVITAAMSTSAAALKPQSSATDTPATAIVGGKPRGVRFFSPEAREWHDRRACPPMRVNGAASCSSASQS